MWRLFSNLICETVWPVTGVHRRHHFQRRSKTALRPQSIFWAMLESLASTLIESLFLVGDICCSPKLLVFLPPPQWGRLVPVCLLISAPSLGVIIANNWLCLSVCLSQKNFKLFLLFCFSMESSHFDGHRAIFWPSVLHDPLYKTFFFDFWFRPLTPKIYSPDKIAYNSTCMADRPEMFGLNRGFSGWPMQWNHAKCCGADPCCHGNEIWARRGDLVAYRLVLSVCQLNSSWTDRRWTSSKMAT